MENDDVPIHASDIEMAACRPCITNTCTFNIGLHCTMSIYEFCVPVKHNNIPAREADVSPPTSAEVKKMLIYTSTPPYAFMA
jgi:hypothetical protein